MKKNYFLLILFLVSSSFAQAQYILSMQVTPANPTINDPVTIIAECASLQAIVTIKPRDFR
ncbi:MAG: hypothetical protein IPG39_19465 [Bacteroidetes bacterium]|nr:hypothetical protein [Bacteroidota bacterium]